MPHVFLKLAPRDGLLGAARLAPAGSPWRAIAAAARRRRTGLVLCRRFEYMATNNGHRAMVLRPSKIGSPGRIRTADQRINSSIHGISSITEQERASGKTITYPAS